MYEHFQNGELEKAWEINDAILPLCEFLEGSGKYVQIVKRSMELYGQAGGPSRYPRLGLTEEEEQNFKRLFQNCSSCSCLNKGRAYMLTKNIELKPKVKAFLNEEIKMFINGEFVPSISGKTFETYNPATEDVLAVVYEAQEEDIDVAVKAARSAFESGPWAEMTTAERAHLIYKLADLIEEHGEELAQLEALDNGKPYQVALDDDIAATVENYRYYAGWATKIIGQTIPISKDYLNYTRHEPVGVVGQIIPWNFPLVMSSWKMGAALATGCTIVLKPAEQTPLSLLYAAKLLKKQVFQMVL